MDREESIRQTLTSPYAGDEVLLVVYGWKCEGTDRVEAYRLLDRLWHQAEARGDGHASEALAHALNVVAGNCPPEQAIWEGLLDMDAVGDAPAPVMPGRLEV